MNTFLQQQPIRISSWKVFWMLCCLNQSMQKFSISYEQATQWCLKCSNNDKRLQLTIWNNAVVKECNITIPYSILRDQWPCDILQKDPLGFSAKSTNAQRNLLQKKKRNSSHFLIFLVSCLVMLTHKCSAAIQKKELCAFRGGEKSHAITVHVLLFLDSETCNQKIKISYCCNLFTWNCDSSFHLGTIKLS